MDTREAKIQLPSYLIGDLSPKEAAMLEGHLDVDPEAKAAKESMSRQLLPLINLQAPEVSPAALDKLFVDARRELEKPVYQASTGWLEIRSIALRVAAVLVVGAVLGWGIYGLTPTSAVGGSMMLPTGVSSVFRYGDVIETSQGVPMTVDIKATESSIAMDGSAAIKINRTGKEVVVEVLRGRVIVSAGKEAQLVDCGGGKINVNKRSVAAIEFDTPFKRIVGNGAVVELQRQTITDVARVAEQLYGGRIETSGLNDRVAKRRISLYGVGLRKEEFLAAFKSSSEQFGVTFQPDGKNYKLVYKETAGGSADESENVLRVAPLQGTLTYKAEGHEAKELSERTDAAAVVENGVYQGFTAQQGGFMKAQRIVVWAGRTDLPFFKLDETVSNYIAMGQSGGKVVVASALPAGTVITADGLRFKSGAVVRIGEKFKLDQPGTPSGTLLGVMSSGIEVAKGDDANTRYFVPVSASK